MAYTSDRPITVDGVRLDTLAWNVEKVARATAGRRSANVEVPGVDGVLPSLNDTLEPATFGLDMWLRGTQVDGATPPAGSRTTMRNNLDELLHLFGTRHRLLEVADHPGEPVINYALNPSMESSTWNVGGIGTGATPWTRDNTRAADGTWSLTTTTDAGQNFGRKWATQTPPRAGQVVRWRFRIYATAACTVTPYWERGGPTYTGGSGGQVAVAANTWTDCVGQVTMTAGQAPRDGYDFGFGFLSSAPAGTQVWVDAMVVTYDQALPPAAFHGGTTADATYTYAWQGVAEGSESVATPVGSRRAWAKVTDTIAPDLNEPGSMGRFTVALELPYGVWEDVATSDWTSGQVTSGVAQEVIPLQGATERVTDAVVLVTGPVTNPRVTDPATGAWVQLNQALSSTQFWRVNMATWASRYGTGLSLGSADTDGTDGAGSTQFGGTRNQAVFLPLTPVRDTGQRRVKVALSGSGITTATRVSVRARRKYAA